MLRCFKCGTFTSNKVYFERSAKTVMRFCCANCIPSVDADKVVMGDEDSKTDVQK